MTIARLVAAAIALAFALPGAAWAIGSTPVSVTNPENAPVPVRDAGQTQPVSGVCTYFPTIDSKCDLYTVPAGKRLVIELVSYRLASPTNMQAVGATFGESFGVVCFGCGDEYAFPAGTGVEAFGANLWRDTRAVRFYLNENQTLSASGAFSSGSNSFGQMFTFSGFLVNK
jgi:hypothetical protein